MINSKIFKSSIIVLGVFFGCTPVLDCQLDPNSSSFYLHFENPESLIISFDSIQSDFDPGFEIDPDTVSTLSLPLSMDVQKITYNFYTDTIDYYFVLKYNIVHNLYGQDCPASPFFFNLEVVETNIDTLSLVYDQLDRRVRENIVVRSL